MIFAWSAWHWSTYRYGTFDLAFYVQALWLALRGEWQVSLLDVPLMGNHAEPIVFLALPLFALCQHPMLLVGLQTVALSSLPLTGYRIARRLGLEPKPSFLLAASLALYPATGFVGLHEFHPEALAAPFLLLAIEARLAGRLGRFWLWWLCALATKENIALLLVVWAGVNAWQDRRKGAVHQRQWNLLPGLLALAWLVIYGRFLAPALNGGKVDYLELYSHLGRSAGEIVSGFFLQPERLFLALRQSILGGDLVWGTLLPLLGLPLLRPKWLLIAAPILLQHLLSWRSAEWSIHFHYAAPLIPLFWIATAEAIAAMPRPLVAAWMVLITCTVLQVWRGPAHSLPGEVAQFGQHAWERSWKREQIAELQAEGEASVTAAQPYLSHLAMRRDVHSLHHVLKGLQTLSRRRYEPPATTDFLVIDAADASTFSTAAGYYHPTMRTVEGDLVPSSEILLHEFLSSAEWRTKSVNSLTTMRRVGPRQPQAAQPQTSADAAAIAGREVIVGADGSTLRITTRWQLALPREDFRWLSLLASRGDESIELVRGIIAPEETGPFAEESWEVRVPPGITAGEYRVRLMVTDRLRGNSDRSLRHGELGVVTQIIPLGTHALRPSGE